VQNSGTWKKSSFLNSATGQGEVEILSGCLLRSVSPVFLPGPKSCISSDLQAFSKLDSLSIKKEDLQSWKSNSTQPPVVTWNSMIVLNSRREEVVDKGVVLDEICMPFSPVCPSLLCTLLLVFVRESLISTRIRRTKTRG